ncbi:Dipeptidase 1 [Armadillidium vulgare]|nr:Dipeptidase 1 [Armadillidium vulgare]
MPGLFLYVCVAVVGICSGEFISIEPGTFHERLKTAKQILNEVPLVDGHNDLASNIHDVLNNQLHLFPFDQNLTTLEPWASDAFSHTDLPRLFEGMVGAQFWSAWVPCKVSKSENVVTAMEQIDVIKRLSQDILNAFENGKIASLIGVEGGHTINNSLAVLRTFYDSGVRYLTLTHNCNTAWAESALTFENNSKIDEVEGLTDFGELVIGEMNRLGMLVDLSHTSDRTIILTTSEIVPEGLEDVSKYPNLFAELLLDPSWTKDDLKKLAGLNFLRVFRLVESVKNVLNGEAPIENKMAEDMKK